MNFLKNFFKEKPAKITRSEIIYDHIFSLTSGEDCGLCSPPMKAQVALDELRRYFLGDSWYVSMPENTEQVNTEIVFDIERLYSGDKKSFDKLKSNYIRLEKI